MHVVLLLDNITENLSNPNGIWFAQALFQLEEVGQNKKLLLWFACQDIPAESMLPLIADEPIFVAEA